MRNHSRWFDDHQRLPPARLKLPSAIAASKCEKEGLTALIRPPANTLHTTGRSHILSAVVPPRSLNVPHLPPSNGPLRPWPLLSGRPGSASIAIGSTVASLLPSLQDEEASALSGASASHWGKHATSTHSSATVQQSAPAHTIGFGPLVRPIPLSAPCAGRHPFHERPCSCPRAKHAAREAPLVIIRRAPRYLDTHFHNIPSDLSRALSTIYRSLPRPLRRPVVTSSVDFVLGAALYRNITLHSSATIRLH